MTDNDTMKRAAQYMLRKGLAHPIEIAELSGRSKQIIRIWALEYPDSRAEFLKQQWDKAVKWASKRA